MVFLRLPIYLVHHSGTPRVHSVKAAMLQSRYDQGSRVATPCQLESPRPTAQRGVRPWGAEGRLGSSEPCFRPGPGQSRETNKTGYDRDNHEVATAAVGGTRDGSRLAMVSATSHQCGQ